MRVVAVGSLESAVTCAGALEMWLGAAKLPGNNGSDCNSGQIWECGGALYWGMCRDIMWDAKHIEDAELVGMMVDGMDWDSM